LTETSSLKEHKSEAVLETANPKRQPLRIRQCLACGTEFQPVNGNQVNCSRACRQRFYGQRNRTKIRTWVRSWQAARRQHVNAAELEECLEDPRKAKTIAGPDVIVCLECGAKLKRLGDHVKLHGMTAAEYKRKPAPGGQVPRYSTGSSLSATNLHDSRSKKAKSLHLAENLPAQHLIQSRGPSGPWKMSLEGRLNQRDTNPRKGKGRPDLWRITSEGQVVTDALIAQWRLDGMTKKDIAQHVGIKGGSSLGERLHRMGFPPGDACLFRYGEPIAGRHIRDLCSDFGMMKKELAEKMRVSYCNLVTRSCSDKPISIRFAQRVLDVRPKLAEQYHQATKKRGRRPRTFPSEEISICASYKKLKDDLKVLQKWLEQKGKDVPMSMVWTWLCERSRDGTIRLLFWPEFLEWITTDSDHAKLAYASPYVLAQQLLAKTRDVSEGTIKSILKKRSPKQQAMKRLLEGALTIFNGQEKISTAELVSAMKESDHSSWKDLTPKVLANRLRPLGVKVGTVRLSSKQTAKGYKRRDLEQALNNLS